MHRTAFSVLFLALGALVILGLGACEQQSLIIATDERVTFALVLEVETWNSLNVYADYYANDTNHTLLGTLSAPLAHAVNTAHSSEAKLTTLDNIPTNAMYELRFFIDVNGNGIKDAGDMQGVQFFYVAPSAVWAEEKYFSYELETLP